MRVVSLMLAGAMLLGACHARADLADARGNGQSVRIAVDDAGGGDNMSVAIPGFDAKLALPSFDLGRHVDLDGIRLAPDTKVSGIDVAAHDAGGKDDEGRVVLGFASPRAPAALIDYYRREADRAGYGSIAAGADTLKATKGAKRFALAVSPERAGSRGTITVTGRGG